MRSQVRFVMHRKDEIEFVNFILTDDTVRFIDGPRWPTEIPHTTRLFDGIAGWYCIIWSPEDLATLTAAYTSCNDWYCNSEHATIQFLRSQIDDDLVLTEGRIAVSTTRKGDTSDAGFKGVETRYKLLRRFVHKTYANSIVQWINPAVPVAPAGPN